MNYKNKYNMKMLKDSLKTLFYLLLIGCMTLTIAGCDNDNQGPAEKAGEEIDETIQQLETDAKDTKQKAEEKAEEIVNDAERAIEDATD